MRFLRYTPPEYAQLDLMMCFQEPATAKQTFSSAHDPTVWRTIPVLEFLLQSWENMANLPKFSEIEPAIRKGLENINKWYRKVNDTDAYFICLGMFIIHITSVVPHAYFIKLSIQTSKPRMQKRNGRMSFTKLAFSVSRKL